MTRAFQSRPSASLPAPRARLATALAASAAAHWLLLSTPLPDLQWQAVAPGPDGAPITVRLAPMTAPVPHPPEKWGQSRFSAPAGQGQIFDSDPIFPDAPTLPGAPDPNYYPARELDFYPRPLVPLQIDRLAGGDGGEVRLEILIDERGVVRDVAYAGAAPRSEAEEALRAMLAATPFLPAFKDGRPVKSRLLMSINFKMGSE